MGHEPNFIPDDLRAKLEADADEARRKGDRNCEHILRQLAALSRQRCRAIRS